MSNSLYPIFVKLETLSLLIIGGGKVALEKLDSVLNNAPQTSVKLVAKEIIPEVKALQEEYKNLVLEQRAYTYADFDAADLVIAAVNDLVVAEQIRNDAHVKGVLVNIADKPELCDFYLGSIVRKGELKIAISTNGKSPTIAKRLREILTETIPDEIDEVLDNMQNIRQQLKGDFEYKIQELNRLTTEYLSKENSKDKLSLEIENLTRITKIVQRRANIYLGIIGVMLLIGILGIIVYQFNLWGDIQVFLNQDGHIFYWMLFVGFLAEIVAGSMGMGYGVICTTVLLLLNVPPPVVSASIHSAESFTTAAGSISHYKLGNVNKKMVWILVPVAILGAIIGAFTLSHFGEHYAHIVKPIIACYTLYLGANILKNAFKKKGVTVKAKRKTNLRILGLAGGFIDSFAGGGWGPLVTGTLMKDGRTPRYVVGSSTVAKFLLTVTSAITFIFTIGIHHWNIVLGLLLGGIFTAPFSAMLTAKLPTKKMFIVVGSVVIIMSLTTIIKALL
ncbi:TSUP family transporter [Elizabethkingia anophelis]|uniref:Probable membrane transporter protein n=3 Tax=Elizabethkingia anophelis TaxID=1117645 RepID=A0A077EHA9_9FLAO|nr:MULTISPECIES: TSUP family transporter [Elizabethkingia]AIL47016.1 Siroheme synthase / Precorrin-2 oxidase / Sirohydrochlorin ferrochelatase [Elizabethkingia anophelis NUHP1]ATC36082.1 ABC transporter permease [Elizabethkingia anophelis R26]ATC39759.1 ABC transporter permease [Elizabethkingia anophelis Ag1]ATC43438.1 ABC transporter permease [Elizabethkingia anophelis]ATC47114.1 ABC transporter permease [Elizabethkingia anophelis]